MRERGDSERGSDRKVVDTAFEFGFSTTELKETQRSMKNKRLMKIVPPSCKEQKVDPMENDLLKRFP